MFNPATIHPRIIEALYCEALVLSDEVRQAFTMADWASQHPMRASRREDPARAALSAEGLRTTTRMMHAIAWLLNHRAFFRGEITDLQLRRQGRLPHDMRDSDEAQLALLEPAITQLIDATRRLYDRLVRLDQSWPLTAAEPNSAIHRLRERIEGRLAS